MDKKRKHSPLKRVKDSILIQTDKLSKKEVLKKMVEHHKFLKAELTIPFASFVRFARKDNQHMNEFANTVFDAKEKFKANNTNMVIQAIGGDYLEWHEVDQPAINERKIDEQGMSYFSLPLDENHDKHVALYGDKLDERLTGDHETCSINEFRAGDSDRGASIRIPVATSRKGYGYLEDRRPGANSDAYIVAARLLASICGSDEAIFKHIYKKYTSSTFKFVNK